MKNYKLPKKNFRNIIFYLNMRNDNIQYEYSLWNKKLPSDRKLERYKRLTVHIFKRKKSQSNEKS